MATAPLQRRYRDAYSVAEATIGWGTVLKILGVLGGLAIALLGLVAASHVGFAAALASFIVAVSVAGTMYALGVTVAAQGQIIRAILDTAVNTSPLLSNEEKREVLVTSGEQALDAAPPAGDWINCQNCLKLIRLDANENTCYLCHKRARPG